MFEKGEIVNHNNIYFGSYKDQKKNRPCIVLFELELEEPCVVTCPLTSSIRAFNKHPNRYIFVQSIIYNKYHKLSFAKLENIMIQKVSETHKTGEFIDKTIADKIINYLKHTSSVKYKLINDYLNSLEQENGYQKELSK